MRKRFAAVYLGVVLGIPLGLISFHYGAIFVVEIIFLIGALLAAICGLIIALDELTRP